MHCNSTKALTIEHLPVRNLILDTHNSHRHSEHQIKQVAETIKTFGFNVPILVDENNKLLAGEGRIRAAKKLGLTRVPVIRLAHLTPAQASAFSITDNRLTEHSTWADRLLGGIFGELAALELDFSLEVTGAFQPNGSRRGLRMVRDFSKIPNQSRRCGCRAAQASMAQEMPRSSCRPDGQR